MSGPKRNPDKLNTIGVVVVGICGAVLVYVSIVALQAFYMNDTSEVQTMADYGGQDTTHRSIRTSQLNDLASYGPNPLQPGKEQSYHVSIDRAIKLVVDAAKVDPANLVPMQGRADKATIQPVFGRPRVVPAPAPVPADGAAPADGAGSAAPPADDAGSAAPVAPAGGGGPPPGTAGELRKDPGAPAAPARRTSPAGGAAPKRPAAPAGATAPRRPALKAPAAGAAKRPAAPAGGAAKRPAAPAGRAAPRTPAPKTPAPKAPAPPAATPKKG